MKIPSRFQSLLLATSAVMALSACSGSDPSSPGASSVIATLPPANNAPDTPTANPDAIDLTFGGCPIGTTAATLPNSAVTACQIIVDGFGNITSDLTLTASASQPRAYFVEQATFIGTDDGPTPGALGGSTVDLTIQGGATLVFLNSTDFLTVNRGSRLIATGSAAAPIALTSDEDIIDDGVANDSQGSARGQWGGLILNGRAPINSCADPSVPAMCEASGEGGTGTYGGDNPADDSGVLNYVRVQYAGFAITPGNELNGIAFQGVGSGTNVDFIQVHNNDDDGVEFFGGTVNVRHVVITGVDDDAFDWVAGWTGSAQDVLNIGSGVGDNGFEGDNNSSLNDQTPRSNPMISNFTMIGGPSEDLGMQIREGTAGVFINGIVSGWEDGCLDIDDSATFNQVDPSATIDSGATDLQFSSLFFSCETPLDDFTDSDGTVDEPFSDIASFPGISVGNSTLSGVLPGANEAAVASIDASTVDPALVNEAFIGAFAPGLAPADTWAFGWTVPGSVFPPQGCPVGTTDITGGPSVPAAPSGGAVCEIPTTVTQDTTLTTGNLYALAGAAFVGQDAGPDVNNPNPVISATLTIQAGVTIYGTNSTDFLTVNRGSQIIAAGTQSAPIIMTSLADVNGENLGSERGQWGGLIINGRAPINSCADPSVPEACEASGEGGTGNYGGNAPNDNSGLLNFFRVQFAGFAITPGNELNGIAFQGVGDGTEIDFVQVHNNDDDGVEFFGGTVDVSHLVITGVDDDAVDWVAGWNGSAQYILIAGSGVGDNGFEGDNNSSLNDQTPRSNPTIANWTAIGGPSEDLGMQIREGTAGTFLNGVVTGWDDGCLDIDDGATFNQINTSSTPTPGIVDLQFISLFFSCETPLDDFTDSDGAVDEAVSDIAAFEGISVGTSSLTSAPGFTSAFLNGANEDSVIPVDPSTVDPALENVSQIGALANDADDWFVGWTVPGSL